MRRLLDRMSALLGDGKGRTRGGIAAAWAGATKPLETAGLSAPVEKALAFLDARYDSHFSIEDAARAACVSPAWLSVSFKRSVGVSVMGYARFKRTEKACELLGESDAPLKEIADRLAFPDLPTFAKLFRKIVGISPGAYRKALRSGHNLSGAELGPRGPGVDTRGPQATRSGG